MKPLLIRLLAACFLTAATAAPAAEVLDRILVIVNDGVILQSELDRAMQLAQQQIRARKLQAPPDEALRAQVMDRLILARLQTQRAQQAGIRIEDRELNDIMSNLAKDNGLTLAQFADTLRKDGGDYLTVREQVRDEVLITRIRQREVDSRVSVSDQDVELLLASESQGENIELRLSHLLVAVPDGATEEQRSKARKKADDLLARINKGEDFAQLAVGNSDGQQALQGGDLDWRQSTDLPSLFSVTAAKLSVGQVSAVLEAASGFHIIKLADRRGGEKVATVSETRVRHILITPNAVRDDDQARVQARDLYERMLKGEKIEDLAPKFSDDPGSKNSGGDLGFQAAGTFAPDFQIRLDQLKQGEISPPFKTQFGWHVAQLIERRTRDVTDETRRARAKNLIGQRKAAEEYDVWLRRLRAEAYVEYRAKSDAEAASS